MNKNLITLLAIPLLALNGCRDTSEDFQRCKVKGDYVVMAVKNQSGNHFKMQNYILKDDLSYSLNASDNFEGSNILDGRFDIVTLIRVPKGDVLEQYANLDSITKLFYEVKETGCDCDSMFKAFAGKIK